MKKKKPEVNETKTQTQREAKKEITSPEASPDTEVINAAGNFKPIVPKTFKGDRGGAAEDADLLAELRAISSKSTTNRFDANGENEENVSNNEMEGGNNIKKESSLPPWK